VKKEVYVSERAEKKENQIEEIFQWNGKLEIWNLKSGT